ncbi:MAG: ComEA family DNA-binding protein [Chloroflexota bacterium]
MERVGEWRMIESEEPDEAAPAKAAIAEKPPVSARLVIAAVAAAVLGVAGVAIWATLPQGGVKLDLASGPGLVPVSTADPGFALPTMAAARLVVDVEGAVVSPGVHQVAAGSRVADAISAAGGYSTEVDIAAAAAALNLAEPLSDGQKIHVPARGEVASLPDSVTPVPGGLPAGPIDINHASADELDTLPGIGPVTAAKIIAARPFATIDELDTRDVVGPSTLDKIRELIVVTP